MGGPGGGVESGGLGPGVAAGEVAGESAPGGDHAEEEEQRVVGAGDDAPPEGFVVDLVPVPDGPQVAGQEEHDEPEGHRVGHDGAGGDQAAHGVVGRQPDDDQRDGGATMIDMGTVNHGVIR